MNERFFVVEIDGICLDKDFDLRLKYISNKKNLKFRLRMYSTF